MKRTLAAVVKSVMSMLAGPPAPVPPARRSVTLAPRPTTEVRRDARRRKRARLARRWSAVMAQAEHPVATMWRGFWAKRCPEIAGHSPRLSAGLPGWKSFKKRARAAVAS